MKISQAMSRLLNAFIMFGDVEVELALDDYGNTVIEFLNVDTEAKKFKSATIADKLSSPDKFNSRN